MTKANVHHEEPMFGLKGEKGDSEDTVFDLENDLKSPGKAKELRNQVQDRMLTIKSVLREGQQQEDYNRFGILLHGYASLLKVFGRLEKK